MISWLENWIRPSFGTVVALTAVAFMAIYPVVPYVEGRFLPVTLDNTITRIDPNGPNGWTTIEGNADKVRGECQFISVEWHLGDPDVGGARAQLRFLETTKNRPEGRFAWGEWAVQLTETQLRDNSYAITTHKCHWLWPTKTLFWDSRRDEVSTS